MGFSCDLLLWSAAKILIAYLAERAARRSLWEGACWEYVIPRLVNNRALKIDAAAEQMTEAQAVAAVADEIAVDLLEVLFSVDNEKAPLNCWKK